MYPNIYLQLSSPEEPLALGCTLRQLSIKEKQVLLKICPPPYLANIVDSRYCENYSKTPKLVRNLVLNMTRKSEGSCWSLLSCILLFKYNFLIPLPECLSDNGVLLYWVGILFVKYQTTGETPTPLCGAT